jgi:hypothetical protein
MTTHLEEVVAELEEFPTVKGWELHKSKFVIDATPEEIKNTYINSHIKYLEWSIEFLEKMKREVRTLESHPNEWVECMEYEDETWNDCIDTQISHKQQELLQAKELLK